jgi:hypothetical protein
MAQLAESDVAYGSIVALHENHAFIPSVCALGLTGVDPFFDLAGTTGDMPFDSVFMPTPNEEHVLVTPAGHAWIMDEILGTATAAEPVVQDAAVPMLVGAVPNPFNPLTRIVFTLPRDTEIDLWVADLKGRRLRTLHEGELAAGRHAALWNGLDDTGSALSSGVYLVVLDHRGNRAAKRVTLVR